jgi:hypothetical protein
MDFYIADNFNFNSIMVKFHRYSKSATIPKRWTFETSNEFISELIQSIF